MDYKVEYITRLFQKTSNKAIEHYCLTRLWHRLDNEDIKFVPQQYVNRHTDKYALTDVYLPQFKIHIEVNEPAHYISIERVKQDQLRKQEIEKNTGHTLYEIDCRHDLKQIHDRIDEIVTIIKDELLKQEEAFKPWQPEIERSPNHWKSKGRINITDEVSFSNIEDICNLFDADFNKTKRGFLRRGGVSHPKSTNYLLWWPSATTRQGWLNKLSANEYEIIETHIDETKRAVHFNEHLNTSQIRIVFFHHKDLLGLTSYKFKGIYIYDNEKSSPLVGTVWRRLKDSINIDLTSETYI